MSGGYCLSEKEASLEKTGKTHVWRKGMDCIFSVATRFSVANLVNDEEKVDMQTWVNLAAVFAIILGLQLFRRSQRKMASECDERDTSASDYAICVENIPVKDDIDYQKELKEFFENFKTKSGTKLEVCIVDLAYELTKLTK
jgi:hypothetical protein